jgi:hypothetical protein
MCDFFLILFLELKCVFVIEVNYCNENKNKVWEVKM